MLKAQCACGHRVAVADSFSGKRVKCPKCKGPLQIPKLEHAAAAARPSPARPIGAPPAMVARAAAAPPPVKSGVDSDTRIVRARRHALERKRKSHNMTVGIIAGAMVILGLGAMLVVGMLNKPDPLAVAQADPEKKSSPREGAGVKVPRTIAARTPSEMAGGEKESVGDGVASRTDDDVTVAGHKFTAGSNGATPVASTATYDDGGNVTTIQSQATTIAVGEKSLQMTVTVTHDGKKVREATDVGAVIHLKGDFTGLALAGVPDEPRLTIEADRREFFLPPSKLDQSDERKKENGPEILPGWVEYSLGRTELLTIARGRDLRVTVGGTLVTLTPEQIALFQSFAPEVAAPPATPEKNVEEGAAPAGKAAVDGDAPVEKEMLDEKEMKKK